MGEPANRTRTSRLLHPKVVVTVVLLLGLWAYRSFIYKPDIVRPDRFQVESSAGLRALGERRFADAERHFEAAAIELRSLDPRHPRRGISLLNQAQLRFDQKQFDASEPLYREAMTYLETGRAEHELATTNILDALAALHVRRGEYSEAERLIRRELEINQRLRGPREGVVERNLLALSAVLLAQGKPGDAFAPMTRAAKIVENRGDVGNDDAR